MRDRRIELLSVYRNGEGYFDPTAGEAIRRMTEDRRRVERNRKAR